MPNAEEIWVLEDSVTVGRNAKQDSQRCPAPSGGPEAASPQSTEKNQTLSGVGGGR